MPTDCPQSCFSKHAIYASLKTCCGGAPWRKGPSVSAVASPGRSPVGDTWRGHLPTRPEGVIPLHLLDFPFPSGRRYPLHCRKFFNRPVGGSPTTRPLTLSPQEARGAD